MKTKTIQYYITFFHGLGGRRGKLWPMGSPPPRNRSSSWYPKKKY